MRRLSTEYGRALCQSLGAAVCTGVMTLAPAGDPINNSPADNPSLVARPSDVATGKFVQSPEGTVIGTVHDVIPERNGHLPAYVLVATGSGTAAIPYWAISHMIRDAHLVVDRTTLAQAPRIPTSGAPKGDDSAWKEQADSYWHAYR